MSEQLQIAISALQQGKMIILVDDESRENEGDLVAAAEYVTPEIINFMTHHARGVICLPMLDEYFERLQIPMIANTNRTPFHNTAAFGAPFEAAHGITTGISAFDRAYSISVAINPNSGPSDIIMPGHMFPLKARPNGVLTRAGHTEGSVDLCRLAHLKPAATICEILNHDGSMARLPQLKEFSQKFNIPLVTIQDILTYRQSTEPDTSAAAPETVELIASANLPTQDYSDFIIKVFRAPNDPTEHIALISKNLDRSKPCLTRIHSECLTGDVFHSARCDCGEQLTTALRAIAQQNGILLYMRQEGRGIGLGNKIKTYALQDTGLDTVQANHHLGFATDLRDYKLAAQILQCLDIRDIRLLTNNPKKIINLIEYDIHVHERVPLEVTWTHNNKRYLQTKKEKMGHLLTESNH